MYRLLFLALVCVAGISARADGQADTIRVMTFNIHAGHDASLQEIGEFIKLHRPDFVALQEVDHKTRRANCRHQNGRDFITELALYSGMQGYFGPTINFGGGLYGIGILSRHPLVAVGNHKMPRPNAAKEQRGLLEGTFTLAGGDTLVFACTHFEAFDSVSRVRQAEYVNRHFAAATCPVIIAGDFNASPDDAAIRSLTERWLDCTSGEPTFSVTSPAAKIDYVLAQPRGRWRTVRSEVPHVSMSDHFPVIATLVLTR